MTKWRVLALMLCLLVATALLLSEGWMAGFAIGAIIVVPFCFLASILFAQLINLDRRVSKAKSPPAEKIKP